MRKTKKKKEKGGEARSGGGKKCHNRNQLGGMVCVAFISSREVRARTQKWDLKAGM